LLFGAILGNLPHYLAIIKVSMFSTALEYNWQLSDFQYDLPNSLIAQEPCAKRTGSRLLHMASSGSLSDLNFLDIESLLRPGDLLVLNNTEVIPARLFGCKATGGRVEIMVERIITSNTVSALIKASKSPKVGTKLLLGDNSEIEIEVTGRSADLFSLQFPDDVLHILSQYGQQPLPPYITRAPEASDLERYQTVFAAKPGAAAAPTAGLHFDEALLARLQDQGIETVEVTLHVGAGTFQPVRCENIKEHNIHAEWIELTQSAADTINKSKSEGRRVIAIGTTSVRVLESAAQNNCVRALSQATRLFITPGFEFQIVDALLTNFHLPGSSLLMLVSAFTGHSEIMNAYKHAVEKQYRFFSYGDAMFLEKNND
jgi:S-adenosylmethionine:tRNA ribosyltransferase-isomerase